MGRSGDCRNLERRTRFGYPYLASTIWVNIMTKLVRGWTLPCLLAVGPACVKSGSGVQKSRGEETQETRCMWTGFTK